MLSYIKTGSGEGRKEKGRDTDWQTSKTIRSAARYLSFEYGTFLKLASTFKRHYLPGLVAAEQLQLVTPIIAR